MIPSKVKEYFESAPVVRHYAKAAVGIGLWKSEEKIFEALFEKEEKLLEIGTGAGRIAFGLHSLGFAHVCGIDFSEKMIREARRIAEIRKCEIKFRIGDATRLNFRDGKFDGVIFGFNGLMQIPERVLRLKALREINRVLKPGGKFVFTTHDRESGRYRNFWKREKQLWQKGRQKRELDDFGDRFERTPLGDLFIHVPTREEIRNDLDAAGFDLEANIPRSHLANESFPVREFSDDCLFWAVRKFAEISN